MTGRVLHRHDVLRLRPGLRPAQEQIVDQSDDVRDPADDSGEIDDPTAMAENYPGAFDGRVDEAEEAVAEHSATQGRRSGGGNG